MAVLLTGCAAVGDAVGVTGGVAVPAGVAGRVADCAAVGATGRAGQGEGEHMVRVMARGAGQVELGGGEDDRRAIGKGRDGMLRQVTG